MTSLTLCDIIRRRWAVLIQERRAHAIDTLMPAQFAYAEAKAIDTAYGVAINELERLLATAAALEKEQTHAEPTT